MIEPTDFTPLSKYTEQDYKQLACMLGYDPNKVHVMDDLPKEHSDSMPQFQAQQIAVTIADTDIRTGDITVFTNAVPEGHEKSVLAHELNHVCFYLTVADMKKSKRLFKHFTDVLSPIDLINDCDFITTYAHNHVLGYLSGEIHDTALVISEVLGEMARVYHQTGTLPNNKEWKKL